MNKMEAWAAFGQADAAWQAELVHRFGKRAGDVRYTRAGKGEPGSELRRLHDNRKSASETWLATRLAEHEAKGE